MTRFAFLLIPLFTLCVHPVWAQSTTETVQSDSVIEVGEDARPDGEIRDRIVQLLGEIDGFDNVDVSVSGGVVTLDGTVIDSVAREELTSIANRVVGVVAIENRTAISGSLEERLAPAAERISGRVENLITNAPIFLVALATFLVIAIGGWVLTTKIGFWARIAPNRFIADVYRAVARIAFIVLGVVLALDILNATALIGAVLGAAGVVGLALGFAVRDTVENFIASILLSLRQPFRPNDFVDIGGDQGTVARLTSRATILISPEGNHIRIPNATVYKGRIVNFTRDPQRRFDFELGVDADADLSAAMATAVTAIEGLPYVLSDPEVSAWVQKVGDSNVVLFFAAWVDQSKTSYAKARGEAIRTAKTALETAGFGLPEPIYRLRIDTPLAQLGTAGTLVEMPAPDTALQDSGTSDRNQADASPHQPDTPPIAAADPARVEDAPLEAASRERETAEDEDNLLDPQQQGE